MTLEQKLKTRLYSQGADFVHLIDVSHLSEKENRGYPRAILIGTVLSTKFVQTITDAPSQYVQQMKDLSRKMEIDFYHKEAQTDQMADETARWLESAGYAARSQSEDCIESDGIYDSKTRSTHLPHKTLASLAGLGWMGKNNLLITPKYGSAVSLCSLLTTAPFTTELHQPQQSKCGDCMICMAVCEAEALKGKTWKAEIDRNEIIDVEICNTCLKCLVHCRWTQKYLKNSQDISGV